MLFPAGAVGADILDGDTHLHIGVSAPHHERDVAAHADTVECVGEVGEAMHWVARGLHDDVAQDAAPRIGRAQAGALGRRAVISRWRSLAP